MVWSRALALVFRVERGVSGRLERRGVGGGTCVEEEVRQIAVVLGEKRSHGGGRLGVVRRGGKRVEVDRGENCGV